MKLLTYFALLTTQLTYGALSPLSQSLKEIKDLLNSPYLAERLGEAHPISEINLVDQTDESCLYCFGTQEQSVFVKLNFIKSEKLGPRQYHIEWDYATP
jgi:hypothetical protein